MGGLVSRYFLEVLGGWQDTRALITFGTPYRGSLNALDTLSNGIRKGPLPLGHLTEFCRKCTSIYQLLPIYPAYDGGNGALARGRGVGHPGRLSYEGARCAGLPSRDHQRGRHESEGRGLHGRLLSRVSDRRQFAEHAPVGAPHQRPRRARKPARRQGPERRRHGPARIGGAHEYSDAGNAAFAATKHGSLQNSASLLEHVEGVVTGLDLDLGKFLAPDRRIQLSLQVDDVYFEDEPIVLGIDAGEDRLSLTATIEDSVAGTDVVTRPMRDNRDGTTPWIAARWLLPRARGR
jgi:hypothetical protein